MGILMRSKDGKEIVAVFDIGSGSVGGAFVEISKGEKPKIIFTCREDIVFQDEFKFERFFASMLSSADSVLEKMKKHSSVKIQRVLCTFSAPWYVSQTRAVSFQNEKPMVITQKKIDSMVQHEVADIKKSLDEHYKHVSKSVAEIIEIETVNIKLNGYETAMPFGKTAKTVDASLYVSMTSAHILTAVREKFQRAFATKDVLFRSFSLVSFSTLRDIYTDVNDFIFIDISGEMTDISIARHNTIVETLSFPLGQNFIIRSVSSQLNTIPHEASSLLNLYVEGKVNDDMKKKIEYILTSLEREWVAEFKKNLLSLSSYTVLPGKIFLATDAPFDTWFSHVIQNGNYQTIPLMRDKLETETLRTSVLEKFVYPGNEQLNDLFVIIEALFAQKVFMSSG